MRIFHIATKADWERAQTSGTYTTSTWGRTLAQEGFIHACRQGQIRQVMGLYYGDVTEPLVVLEIDTDRLTVPWQEDSVDGQLFPHIYGALDPHAVVGWRPARQSDVTSSETGPRPTPMLTLAFRGFALVSGTASIVFLATAARATTLAHDAGQSGTSATTVLWAFFFVTLAGALVGLGFAEWVRDRDPHQTR